MKILISLLFIGATAFAGGAVTFKVGDSAPINSKAALEVKSTTKGILFPRMTTTQKNAISSPPAGLCVHDTTLAATVCYDGSSWLTPVSSLNSQTGKTQVFANDANIIVTSSNNTHALGFAGTLSIARGGTGKASFTAGSILFVGGGGTPLTENNSKLFWDSTNVSLGIGTNSPTARLTLPAGTATANTAPLKFTSGTLLSVSEDGAMEYNGTDLYFTNSANRRTILQTPDSFAAGGILYTNSAIPHVLVAGTSGQVLLSGGSGSPTWGAGITTPISIANGGTNNGSLGVAAGGIYYADGTKIVEMVAGTSGQSLLSGGSGVPTWGTGGGGGNFAVSQNELDNPGWESGTSNWTASAGTYSRDTTAANVGSGIGAAKWITGASSRTLCSDLKTISSGLYGHSGAVSCNVKGATADHTLSVSDGTNTLISVPVTHGSNYVRTSANFPYPTSGSLKACITSASSETIYIDDCYVGDAIFLNTFTQQIASDMKDCSAYLSLSASFGTTSNVSYLCKRIGDVMHARVTGQAGTVTGGALKIVIGGGLTLDYTKLSTYTTQWVGTLHQLYNGGSTALLYSSEAQLFTDGTDTGAIYGAQHYTGNAFSKDSPSTFLNNTDAFASDFEVPITQWANTGTVYRPDHAAAVWAGHHTVCDFTTTSGSFADPSAQTCAFVEDVNVNFGTVTSNSTSPSGSASFKPQIEFIPNRSGYYWVCARVSGEAGGNSQYLGYELADGSNNEIDQAWVFQGTQSFNAYKLCGVVNAPTTASTTVKVRIANASGSTTHLVGAAANWNGHSENAVHAVTWQIYPTMLGFPAPLLVGSVNSGSTGTERIERAYITNGGSCAISKQSGSWVSSATLNGTGQCDLVLASGIFSASPSCVCSYNGTGGGISSRSCSTGITDSTHISGFVYVSSSGSGQNLPFDIICMGPH